MSVHRFIGGENLFTAATLAAGAIRPASAIRRRTGSARTGNGRPVLAGPYTGAADTTIEVEVLSGGGTPAASTPVHQGVGTGTMDDLAALAGATSQTYTLTLVDTGTTTAAAFVDLEGVTLQAAATGAGGNAINLSVDQSGLSYTPTDFSLLADLAEGATQATGPGWDWDTAVQFGEQVPSGAKRVTIGDDRGTIYRQWKAYEDGQWVYKFLPAMARAYRAGERVYEVSGSRTVTVTDGVSPETYPGIVTLFDLLDDLRNGSDLVTVVGSVSETPTPDNLAAVLDLRTRTDARVDWTSGEGSKHARGFIDTAAGTNASTEIVTAECYSNSRQGGGGIGRELWRLTGSVSGDLGTVTTGERYLHPAGRFALRVPTRLPDGWGEPRGDISASTSYASRGDGETEPPICVDRLRLGPNAEDKAITFIYTQRPSDACACENTDWVRLTRSDLCLGLDSLTEEDPDMSTALAAGHAARLRDVQKWHADFVAANTDLDSSTSELRSAIHDIALADAVRSILLTVLARLYTDGVLAWTAWSASTAVSEDAVAEPTTANGYKYRAQGAGTTDSSEPTWPTTVGNTVTDNDITWECIGKKPAVEFDDLLSAIDTDLTALEAIETDFADFESVDVWTSSTAYTRGDIVRPAVPTPTGAYGATIWVCIAGGTSDTSFSYSDYPFGYILNDGTANWMSLGTLPFWSSSDINSITGESSGISISVDDFVRRYGARADYVLAQAEVTPDFNQADTTGTLPGGACWQDPGDAYWWVPTGMAYMPAFTNREYVSVLRKSDPDVPDPYVPTHEFGFVIKVECTGDLAEGDQVTIHIGDAGWPATYLEGDRLHMATLAAAPLYLSGGITGSDEHTWEVRRSTDGIGTAYVQDLDSPDLYDDGDVQFRLAPGGVAHAVGDQWSFCISADAWQWRQDAGSWDGPHDIGADGGLPDGLAVTWEAGACPAYVTGDTAAWDVLQPYAAANAETPTDERLAWDGSGCTLSKTVSGTVDCVSIALHSLPDGASVTVSDGAALNESMTWREGPMVLLFDPLTDPTLTITIADATGGQIGWLWVGQALHLDARAGANANATTAHQQRRLRRHQLQRGGGRNPRGLLTGSGWGYTLTWPGFVPHSSLAGLLDLIDWAADGGRPIVFLPHESLPAEAELVALPDEIAISEHYEYQNDSTAVRHHAVTLELAPWLI